MREFLLCVVAVVTGCAGAYLLIRVKDRVRAMNARDELHAARVRWLLETYPRPKGHRK